MAARCLPPLSFFLIGKITARQVVTIDVSKFFLKLVPKLSALFVNFGDRFFILRIGSPTLHPDGHDGPGESTTDGTFPSNPSTKTGCQPGKKRILVSKILLETQGDRFSSVEPFFEMTLRPLADHLSVLCFFHVFPPPWPYALLTDMLAEVNLSDMGILCAQLYHVSMIYFPSPC